MDPETAQALREQFGLVGDSLTQYVAWLGRALTGDLGDSYRLRQDVLGLIADRLPITLELIVLSMVIAVGIGIPLGILQARFRDSSIDYGGSLLALIGLSIPVYFAAMLGVLIFAVWLGWLPAFGSGDDPLDRFRHLLLPAMALSLGTFTLTSRMTRSAMRALVDLCADVLRRTGKGPVVLYKPIVGFLVNRLQHAILHEAYYLIEAGVASAADIDHAARRMLAPRMCINGLIAQKDLSGLSIHAGAQASIVTQLFHNGVPNPMLQNMVKRGETGTAAGKGFYSWDGCDTEAVRKQASVQLAKLTEFLDSDVFKPAPRTQPKPRDPRQ